MIYWAWSNILSLAQQSYIMRKHGVEIHLMGNLERTFQPVANIGERLFGAAREKVGGIKTSNAATDEKEAKTADNADDDRQKPAKETDIKDKSPKDP